MIKDFFNPNGDICSFLFSPTVIAVIAKMINSVIFHNYFLSTVNDNENKKSKRGRISILSSPLTPCWLYGKYKISPLSLTGINGEI